MVKAPIVSRVGDHKRQDLHIRPANRHYVASGGPCVSPQQSTHIGRSAVRRGIGLSRCGTLTMPLPNPHERIAREHRDMVDVERRIERRRVLFDRQRIECEQRQFRWQHGIERRSAGTRSRAADGIAVRRGSGSTGGTQAFRQAEGRCRLNARMPQRKGPAGYAPTGPFSYLRFRRSGAPSRCP
jgi:hypothetical protein